MVLTVQLDSPVGPVDCPVGQLRGACSAFRAQLRERVREGERESRDCVGRIGKQLK